MSLLRVQDLTKRFGGLIAVNDVIFDVEDQRDPGRDWPERGRARRTLFKLIASFLGPPPAKCCFNGERIGPSPTSWRSKGVVRTFQETTVFKDMTALENVVVAHHLRLRRLSLARRLLRDHRPPAPTSAVFGATAPPRSSTTSTSATSPHERRENLPHGYLRALGIAHRSSRPARNPPLDEPFAGMNPDETDRAVRMVRGIRDRGVTVLLVEHDMPLGHAASRTASSSSASARRSPRAPPPRSSATTPSSRPISAARTRTLGH